MNLYIDTVVNTSVTKCNIINNENQIIISFKASYKVKTKQYLWFGNCYFYAHVSFMNGYNSMLVQNK